MLYQIYLNVMLASAMYPGSSKPVKGMEREPSIDLVLVFRHNKSRIAIGFKSQQNGPWSAADRLLGFFLISKRTYGIEF